MSSNGSAPPPSWPTPSAGPSGSGSPGVLVYVVVLISIAGLFSVGALLRFCIRKQAPLPGALPGAAGQGTVQNVAPLQLVPEYEAKTVTNPDGSFGLAVNLDHPLAQNTQPKQAPQLLELAQVQGASGQAA